MDPDIDSLDDILLPPATTGRTPGKFRPKSRPKTVKPVPTPSQLPDATQLIPPTMEPPPLASDLKYPDEKLCLPTSCIDGSFTNASNLDITQGSVNQAEALHSEPLVSNGKNEVASQCDPGGEDADMFFSMESLDLTQPLSTNVRAVGRFQPMAKAQSKDKKLVTTSVADPGSFESVGAPTHSSSSFAREVLSSELHLTQEPYCLIEETQAGVSLDRAHVSNSDASLQIYPDKSEAEAMAVVTGLESLDDVLFQSTSEQAQGKFQPKIRPKIIKRVPTSSISVDAAQLIPPTLDSLPRTSDVKCLEEGPSLSTYFMGGNSTIGACTSKLHDSLNQLEASYSEDLISDGDNKEASERDQVKSLAICSPVWESLHDDNQPALTTGVPESLGASNINSSSCGPMAISSELHINQEPLNVTKEPVTCVEASQDGPVVSETDVNLHHHADKAGTEAMEVFSDIESFNDVFFPPSTAAVKQVGKFQPKLVSRPKERKDKRECSNIRNAAETVVPPVDTLISFAQNEGTEMLASNSTEMESSFLQMLGEGSLDDTPHSSFHISDCNGDIQMGHEKLGEEDTSEIPGLESLENISSQPMSTTAPTVGKFQPKFSARVKNVKPSAPVTSHGVTESLHSQRDPLPTEYESMEGHVPSFPADSLIDSMTTWTCNSMPTGLAQEQAYHADTCTLEVASGRDNHAVGREETSAISNDISKEVQPHDAELTQQTLEERSTSKTVEDGGVSKSSRKLRKRINTCSPPDDRTGDGLDFDNPNISHIDEAHSDDDYRGKEVPKQKRVRRKSKRQMTENEKPVRKRKKASEEPSSTAQEPMKKKFPHTTRRKRRQVNKVLLETPEDEIDPKQISIKDLIMLAEAKERISNKEAAALRKSTPNQSSSFPNDSHCDMDNPFETDEQHINRDGDEANHNIQLSSMKLNYHSFMKRSSSRWSKSEIELFYQAIRQFGTDFAMIQMLFPERTRHQIKLKFKNEERKHPLQVADALIHRSKDHSHFELVIQKLKEEAEKASKEATYDPDATSQDAAGENEESRQPEKEEEQEANDWEGGVESAVKSDDWEGEVTSPDKFNDYEGHFEWDANASSPQDMEKYVYDD